MTGIETNLANATSLNYQQSTLANQD